MTPEYAVVGRIRKPHGIRGELVVEPATDAPETLFVSGRRFFVGNAEGAVVGETRAPGAPPRTVTVEKARPVDGAWLLHLQGIGDRTEAERWRERTLLLTLEELPEPGEDEVYFHDLVGLAVVHADGTPIGTVDALYELPQGLVLEVVRPALPSVMIPYRPEVVAKVDLDAKVVTVTPPDGLLD